MLDTIQREADGALLDVDIFRITSMEVWESVERCFFSEVEPNVKSRTWEAGWSEGGE